MIKGDFVGTRANDGTHLIRPITARANTFWQEKKMNRYVIDNNEEYYMIKSVDAQEVCDEIRKNNMDFTS